MKLSVIIIARDEEKKIGQCIKSAGFAYEIIVIDNGSKDRTVQIAGSLNAKVYSANLNNFSGLRNFGAEKAGGEWMFYLDADERIDDRLREEIIKILNHKDVKTGDAYYVKRMNFFFGKKQPVTEIFVRMVRKSSFAGWEGILHETMRFKGEAGRLDGYLLHYTHDDLERMLKKTNEWSAYEAKLRFDAKHPEMSVIRFIKVMAGAFFDSYFRKSGWKTGTTGLIEAIYQSFSVFITYSKLWELQKKK